MFYLCYKLHILILFRVTSEVTQMLPSSSSTFSRSSFSMVNRSAQVMSFSCAWQKRHSAACTEPQHLKQMYLLRAVPHNDKLQRYI